MPTWKQVPSAVRRGASASLWQQRAIVRIAGWSPPAARRCLDSRCVLAAPGLVSTRAPLSAAGILRDVIGR